MMFLAVLVMVGTMGFTVNKHYCMGQLKAIALNEKAESCLPLTSEQDMKDMMKHCCDDESKEYRVEDHQKSTHVFDFKDQPSTASNTVDTSFYLFNYNSQHTQPQYLHKKPPLIDQDIYILSQSLLL
jgi:hypothetical protein